MPASFSSLPDSFVLDSSPSLLFDEVANTNGNVMNREGTMNVKERRIRVSMVKTEDEFNFVLLERL